MPSRNHPINNRHPPHSSQQNIHRLDVPRQVDTPDRKPYRRHARALDLDDGPGGFGGRDLRGEAPGEEGGRWAVREGHEAAEGPDCGEEEGGDVSGVEVREHFVVV